MLASLPMTTWLMSPARCSNLVSPSQEPSREIWRVGSAVPTVEDIPRKTLMPPGKPALAIFSRSFFLFVCFVSFVVPTSFFLSAVAYRGAGATCLLHSLREANAIVKLKVERGLFWT